MQPVLYSIADATLVLGIGRTRLYQLMRSGEIETVHIGRRRLIPSASIDALVARLRSERATA
ncbi:MAG: helix-turn-helix domain-containing protein [Acidimicrobiia bacterium]|nr:helix-turn-helix domain-containing protein [Acidimicrobiia bacterium]